MKYCPLLTTVLLIVVHAGAQNKPISKQEHSINQPTIYIGTDLRLGMPRDAVVARIAEHHRIVKLQDGGDTWMVQEKGDPTTPMS